MKNLKLASRDAAGQTVIPVGDVAFGRDFVVMAGPCSVESEAQTLAAACAVKAAGADILRGGAFKPRTSPYSFQGLGLQGLKILDKARRETGLPIVTEVLDPGMCPGWLNLPIFSRSVPATCRTSLC
jgi:3-deoxy-7-phosphoheptulonate synthase